MKDLTKIVIAPHCTMEFIAGMCAGLSDEHGDIHIEIGAANGKPYIKLKREEIDQALPVFLRKQSNG